MATWGERFQAWAGLGTRPAPSVSPAAPIRFTSGHALLIGIGGDLPGTIDDATKLGDILLDGGRCGYPSTNIKLLAGVEATRGNILTSMEELADRVDVNSTAIIYFSGHGMRSGSGEHMLYHLLAHGYDLTALERTAIEGEEFLSRLSLIQCQRVLLILDCCHAGGIPLEKGRPIEGVPSPLPAPEAVMALGKGRIVIASSREDEVSLAGRPLSLFTVALIEALCGVGASRQDGYVRAADIALYAAAAVGKRSGDRQHPVLHFSAADNFIVSYYAGGAVALKEPPPVVIDERIPDAGGGWAPVEPVSFTAPLFYQPGWIVDTVINVSAPAVFHVGGQTPRSS